MTRTKEQILLFVAYFYFRDRPDVLTGKIAAYIILTMNQFALQFFIFGVATLFSTPAFSQTACVDFSGAFQLTGKEYAAPANIAFSQNSCESLQFEDRSNGSRATVYLDDRARAKCDEISHICSKFDRYAWKIEGNSLRVRHSFPSPSDVYLIEVYQFLSDGRLMRTAIDQDGGEASLYYVRTQ